MEIIFRNAIYDDLESIIKLCDECFDEKTSLEYARKIYLENETDKNQIYLVGTLGLTKITKLYI